MIVREVMNKELRKVSPDTKVSEAISSMLKESAESLIVTPESKEDVYGIITIRDIGYKVLAKGLNPNEIEVKTIASKPLIFIEPDYDLGHAASLMANLNLSRLIVTECKKIVGMVTDIDLLKAYARSK